MAHTLTVTIEPDNGCQLRPTIYAGDATFDATTYELIDGPKLDVDPSISAKIYTVIRGILTVMNGCGWAFHVDIDELWCGTVEIPAWHHDSETYAHPDPDMWVRGKDF